MNAASLNLLIVKTESILHHYTLYYIYSAKEQALCPSIYILYGLQLFLIHPNEKYIENC